MKKIFASSLWTCSVWAIVFILYDLAFLTPIRVLSLRDHRSEMWGDVYWKYLVGIPVLLLALVVLKLVKHKDLK